VICGCLAVRMACVFVACCAVVSQVMTRERIWENSGLPVGFRGCMYGSLPGYKHIPRPPFGGECARIGKSLEEPGSFPLLSVV
jgi:hypothetical protein